ncbi:alpha/beta fold hydrolase [Gordonia phosphorivorans]|uniref:Alpha/beta fold hydrolase n=1 Tax=Gordonia phosphorivorans TaxID=1056982 RepID=A0ABV6H7A7_9ACTN
MSDSTEFRAVARRLTAFGALHRMTGEHSTVTLNETGLTLDDGDTYLHLPAAGPLPDDLPAAWASDAAAYAALTAWLEDYLEQTYQALVIRRHYLSDLVSDPYSTEFQEQLADRFPSADQSAIAAFTAEIADLLDTQSPDEEGLDEAGSAQTGTRSPAAETFHIEVDGLTLTGDRWRAAGQSDEPRAPILMLHGGGQTRHSWNRAAAGLAALGHEVVTMDLRGHGDSGWPEDADYAVGAFTTDLVGTLSTLDLKPVIVGASLGGVTGLNTVGRYPDLAAALVLVDIVVDVEPAGIDRIKEFMGAHIDGFDNLDDVADAIAAYNPSRKRTRNLGGLTKNVRQRADGRWYWHWDPRFLQGGDESRITDVDVLSAAARAVTVPTLLVRGGQSDVVSQEGIDSMLELIPHAEVADVTDAGHMVAGDDNQVFAAAIVDFLDRHHL